MFFLRTILICFLTFNVMACMRFVELLSPDASQEDADTEEHTRPDADANTDSGPCVEDPVVDPSIVRHWRTVDLPGPGRIWAPKLTYDEVRDRVLLYGGRQGSIVSSALLEYDGSTWQKLCDPCDPGPRVGHGFVYDSGRDVLVMYGGSRESMDYEVGPVLHDTWEFSDDSWVRVQTITSPPPLAGMYMAYDKCRRRTVLFGGTSRNNREEPQDDVYEYDGSDWYGPLNDDDGPSPRFDPGSNATFVGSFALDSRLRNKVVIYGGGTHTWGGYNDDLWAWDGTSWTEICGDCTGTPRMLGTLVYDVASGRLVLTCGWNDEELAGTWALDQNSFTLVDDANPGRRDSAGIVYDSARDVIVQYGGNGPSCGPGDCGDTLEYIR